MLITLINDILIEYFFKHTWRATVIYFNTGIGFFFVSHSSEFLTLVRDLKLTKIKTECIRESGFKTILQVKKKRKENIASSLVKVRRLSMN